jgi:hypothetical protein
MLPSFHPKTFRRAKGNGPVLSVILSRHLQRIKSDSFIGTLYWPYESDGAFRGLPDFQSQKHLPSTRF